MPVEKTVETVKDAAVAYGSIVMPIAGVFGTRGSKTTSHTYNNATGSHTESTTTYNGFR